MLSSKERETQRRYEGVLLDVERQRMKAIERRGLAERQGGREGGGKIGSGEELLKDMDKNEEGEEASTDSSSRRKTEKISL